jgi:PAS domain S-box-containing protein
MNHEPSTDTRARILVVEDELIIAKGIERRLKALGYTVTDTVASGEEAVTSAMDSLPDLVLMDICLQGKMDGVTAAERIRSEADIPVVYLTAYADPDSLNRAKVTEPFGYIIKPFQDFTLKSSIEMALYKHRMESRLRRSEQWLATTLRSIGDAVIATDREGKVTFMNPVAQELTGWREEEAIGRDLAEVFSYRQEGAGAPDIDVVQSVIHNGASITFSGETLLVSREGREIPIDAKATSIRDSNENALGIVLSFLDITERKKTEEALRRSERLLSLKNQIANIFLTVADEEMFGEVMGVILDFMKCAYGFFGYLGEEGELVIPSLTGELWEKCCVPEKSVSFPPDCWKGLWGRALREGKSYFSTGPFHLPEGHIPLSSFLVVPLVYRSECIGLLAVADKVGGFDQDDVELLETIAVRTAPILQARLWRDREEKERKRAEAILGRVFDTIPDLFSIIDRDFKVVLSNWHGGYDYVSEEIRKASPFCHKVYYDLDQPCEDCHVREIFATGKPVLTQKFNPKIGYVEIYAYPIFDDCGNVEMVTEQIRDITEKRRMEEDLQKAQKLESIGILAGGIAHDFNNLLTAILGNISLSKLYVPEGDKAYVKLAEAEKASLRARDLTQQLLTFSRGGAPVKKKASLSGIARETASFALSGARTTCLFDIADDLWPVEVDEGQISQVINNLILNADQAMPAGGVVEVSCVNALVGADGPLSLPEGRYVVLSIRDHGEGIPSEILPRIFDPYFTTKKNGKGLGLATVYSIVRNHDGHISVTSQPDQGTTFTIYLPCGDGSAEESADDKGNVPETGSPVAAGRVLVMDDEENIREVAGEMLDFIGYGAEFARDGAEAVELYSQALRSGEPFAAVLLDLTIPGGMGGKEAVRLLREVDPEVRAIVSSGYSNDPIMADYKSFGFRGIITKPYKLTELKKVLGVVIGG